MASRERQLAVLWLMASRPLQNTAREFASISQYAQLASSCENDRFVMDENTYLGEALTAVFE